MSWDYEATIGNAERAALSAGKNIVYVGPPAIWTLRPLLDHLIPPQGLGLRTVFLVPDVADAVEIGAILNGVEALGSVYPVTGIARAHRAIAAGTAGTLACSPTDFLALLRSATPGLREVKRFLAWCSDWLLEGGESDTLDTILGEFPDAQRVFHAAGELPGDFVERHARRAPVIREKAPEGTARGRVRYALAGGNGLPRAVRACLDTLDPCGAFVWDPDGRVGHHPLLAAQPNVEIGTEPSGNGYDLAIAAALPTAAVLRGIQETAREAVVLVRPPQLPALKALSPDSKPIRLPSEADRSRDRAFRLRGLVRELLAGAGESPNSMGFALQAVEPLFYEHDPALVAAALAERAFAAAPEPDPREDLPAWVKIFVTAGTKDGLNVRDVVGAILNSTGIPRDSVGRVDIRDSHTLVEISPEHTNTVVAELNGSTLKGRRLTARVDRKGQPAR